MHFLKRTVYCGHVTDDHVGKEIILNGWVSKHRDLGGVIFVDLRDWTGIVQLMFDPQKTKDVADVARTLRAECVIAVRGTVSLRAQGMENTKRTTGKFEVAVTELQILNKAQPLPFQLDGENVSEEMRLTYRYLDLRRAAMQKNLKLRSDVLFAIRQYFVQNEFCEIETPILSKSTPGGARNFLVPSRLQPGNFYGLVESPQLYKQLLMVGGVEKYFQIARCFRDEALRANRQPEFTQLDIEMSFIEEQDIQTVCEGLFSLLWKKFLDVQLTLPLARHSYDEVFLRFGSDKPDMRFELEIKDVTPVFSGLPISFIRAITDKGGKVGVLAFKDRHFSRSELDKLTDYVTKELGAKGLLWARWREDGTLDSSIAKFLPEDFLQQMQQRIPGLTNKDTLFMVADQFEPAWTVLGQLRLSLGKEHNLIDTTKYSMFWVTDFPMFEWNGDTQKWEAKHHQFTAPQQGWENKDIKDIKARAYDLVCNGEELGGGSIRIHSSEVQSQIFYMLGIDKARAEEKFKFLLESQNLGYPPDGGVAFGIDRLIMILSGAQAIREVIAFPKTQNGSCMMMQAPSTVDENLLKDLYIQSTYKEKE